MASDQDLLFGLLALQIGLIQQAQLVAAFHAWTCNPARSLPEQLLDSGDLDAGDREAIEALVVRHLKRHGGAGRSLATIPGGESLRDSLASLDAPGIGATLEPIRFAGSTTDEAGDSDQTGSISLGRPTSDGQRVRIVRPHARGGLGEVFVAIDGELQREVVLKQIIEKHADDPSSRQRFVAEAEITGMLEHPGVVPVYGLGTDARGRPYYAMRFIKGESLREAIAAFHRRVMVDAARPAGSSHPAPGGTETSHRSDPEKQNSLEFRKLLRRFLDVCNAIDYAHSRGVIHRDIKPANIVLGRHGETLVVDWGLAKSVGRGRSPRPEEQTITPSSLARSSETLPGTVLGTPAFMSPEQAPRRSAIAGHAIGRLQPGRDPLHHALRQATLRESRTPGRS